jgi:hypothetical protein
MFIDSFGMDVWEIDLEGNIINRISDKSIDAFYIVKKDQNGMSLFTLLADNITNSSSMVEFALAQTGIQGDKGLNFITTGHCKSEEPGMGRLLSVQLFNGYTIRSILHSHPKSLNASIADYKFKKYVIDE